MSRVRYSLPLFSTHYRNGIPRRQFFGSQFQWCRAYSSLSPPRYLYMTPQPSRHDKVYIALSSGIDSSVTAKLLSLAHPRENLYPLYMTNWNPSTLTRADLLKHRRPPRDKPSLFHLQDKPKLTIHTYTRAPKEEKCTTREFRLVKELCVFLGLRDPLHMNFEKEYWTEVFEPMVASYERGETPNPDVGCNRWVKFGGLLRKLEEMEARSTVSEQDKGRWWLATGHYANIGYPPGSSNGEPHLLRSQDPNKDQTYFLSTLVPKFLSRLIFPLGAYNLSKREVYDLARKYELPGWAPGSPERSESMGLCFVEPGGGGQGTSGFKVFLSEFLEPSPGEVIVGPELPTPAGVILEGQEGRPKNDTVGSPPRRKKPENLSDKGNSEKSLEPGTIIGQHQGLWTATVGEKAHLNLPQGDIRYQGRWYISGKNAAENQIEVVRGWGNGKLWSTGIIVKGFYWLGKDCEIVALSALSPAPPPLPVGTRLKAEGVINHSAIEEATADAAEKPSKEQMWEERLVLQFRHRQKPIRVASVEILGQGQVTVQSVHVKIVFETPQRAVAPGQNAAMWWGERCLGGGVIDETIQDRVEAKSYNGSAEVEVGIGGSA